MTAILHKLSPQQVRERLDAPLRDVADRFTARFDPRG